MASEANVDRDVFELVKAELTAEEYALLASDLDDRNRVGWAIHGQKLTAHDGRNSPREAYEEALDAMAYLRKGMVEHPGNGLAALFSYAKYLACGLKRRLGEMEGR